MIKKLYKKWHIETKNSFFIGDQISDELCANRSNLRFFYAKKNFYYQVMQIHNK